MMHLILSGVLDAFPKLKIILGHPGEGCRLFYNALTFRMSDPNECLGFLESLPLSAAKKETAYYKNAGIFGVDCLKL